ncbi:DNA primase family protein [Streptomyces sp. NPDC001177]
MLTQPTPQLPDPADEARQGQFEARPVLPGSWSAERPAAQVTGYGLVPDSLSDRGNAKLFAGLYGNKFRYVQGIGWYRWSGYRWEKDKNSVLWAVGDMAEALAEVDASGRHSRAALSRHRRRTLSTPGIRAVIAQAKAAPGMLLSASLLDADPYALCTPGGVVDLHTGELTPPDPARHHHSRATAVSPRDMPTPLWQRFLRDTFGDDLEGRRMIAFLHELLGYSITGDVGAQVMPFLYGQGRNGKTVLMEVMVKLLGDYAEVAPPGFLMARPDESHPTDLAELHGRRMVVCAELGPSDRFDEARVKFLTGGSRIKARRITQDFFSFNPTHKLWLLGNYRPEVPVGGYPFWRRVRVIPLERVVPDDRWVHNLADMLVTEEGPGILNWLINGARRYLSGSRDLTGPQRVQAATHAYAETEDHIYRFLSECCRLDPSMRTEHTRLYAAYRAWCRQEGAVPDSAHTFTALIREAVGSMAGTDTVPSNERKLYPGIGLVVGTQNQLST